MTKYSTELKILDNTIRKKIKLKKQLISLNVWEM